MRKIYKQPIFMQTFLRFIYKNWNIIQNIMSLIEIDFHCDTECGKKEGGNVLAENFHLS